MSGNQSQPAVLEKLRPSRLNLIGERRQIRRALHVRIDRCRWRQPRARRCEHLPRRLRSSTTAAAARDYCDEEEPTHGPILSRRLARCSWCRARYNRRMTTPRKPIVLTPRDGRQYPMGRISAVFKADGAETANAYSISEWWLEAHSTGPGAHSHPEDDIFYVIEGTMSVLVDDKWIDAPAGSFVLVPGGVKHDFENRSDARAGILNF